MIKSVLGILSGAIGFANKLMSFKQQKHDEESGANRERLEQRSRADEVQKRMDAVAGSDVDGTVGKLRNGGF